MARASDNRAEVVCEWDSTLAGKHRYRIISVARFTRGYRDAIVIERLGQDALGEPSWHAIVNIKTSTDETALDLLIDALAAAVNGEVRK